MPSAEDAGRHPALHGRGELQQADGVADLGPRSADPLGQLLVGAGEVLEQLGIGRRLLQRVELRPVQVLQEGVAQHVRVVGLAHDRGHQGQAGRLSRTPPAFAHHQLEGLRARGPHHDRLEQPDLADRVDQLGHRVLVEDLARLDPVRSDLVDRHLGEVRARRGRQPLGPGAQGGRAATSTGSWIGRVGVGGSRPGRDQRPEAASQSAAGTILAHCGAPFAAISRAASR